MTTKANMVEVIVVDSQQMEKARFVVNYSTHQGRARVAKCAGWALNHGYAMTTRPAPELRQAG